MKTYLGDGVYAEWTGYSMAIECNCMSEPNKIFLEPEAVERLSQFYKQATTKPKVESDEPTTNS